MFILTTIFLFPSRLILISPMSDRSAASHQIRNRPVHIHRSRYTVTFIKLMDYYYLFVRVVNNIDFIFHSLSQVRSIRNRIQSVRQFGWVSRPLSVQFHVYFMPCTLHTFRIQNTDTLLQYQDERQQRTLSNIQVAVITSVVLNCHQSDCFVIFFLAFEHWMEKANWFVGDKSVLCIKCVVRLFSHCPFDEVVDTCRSFDFHFSKCNIIANS